MDFYEGMFRGLCQKLEHAKKVSQPRCYTTIELLLKNEERRWGIFERRMYSLKYFHTIALPHFKNMDTDQERLRSNLIAFEREVNQMMEYHHIGKHST